jgi:hypothetical protein
MREFKKPHSKKQREIINTFKNELYPQRTIISTPTKKTSSSKYQQQKRNDPYFKGSHVNVNAGDSPDGVRVFFTNVFKNNPHQFLTPYQNFTSSDSCTGPSIYSSAFATRDNTQFPMAVPGAAGFCSGLSASYVTIPNTNVKGLITGWTDYTDYSKGVTVMCYIKDFTPTDVMAVIQDQESQIYYTIDQAQMDAFVSQFCFAVTPSDDNIGTCPYSRDGVTLEPYCPNFTKVINQGGQVKPCGSVICDSYFQNRGGSSGNSAEYDKEKINFCTHQDSKNPETGVPYASTKMCDCLGASTQDGYYYNEWSLIQKNAGNANLPLEGESCWFWPCRQNDVIRTDGMINPDPSTPCQMPNCVNIVINNDNQNEKLVVCQACCTGTNNDAINCDKVCSKNPPTPTPPNPPNPNPSPSPSPAWKADLEYALIGIAGFLVIVVSIEFVKKIKKRK